MKLLINLCGQDGIISHNSGVGTMLKRYIKVLTHLLDNEGVEYNFNLFTPEYNVGGFGYSEQTKSENEALKNSKIYQLSNGTNGKKFFAGLQNWEELCRNARKVFEGIRYEDYDYVLTLANDTPFAGLLYMTPNKSNHYKVWIPHSTTMIHQEEQVLMQDKSAKERIDWERKAVEWINSTPNCYMGIISKFIKEHLINEYGLDRAKALNIFNGEVLFEDTTYVEDLECSRLYAALDKSTDIVLSFGRPEEYKNLDGAMKIAKGLNIRNIVVTQEYFEGMPYVNYLRELSVDTKTELFVNVSFNFPQYIINKYPKKIILIIPSKKEAGGLLVNEIRKVNKDNILLVVNNVNGLNEQVRDLEDAVLINADNIEESCDKILKNFTNEKIMEINKNSMKRLYDDYDLEKNMRDFLVTIGIL